METQGDSKTISSQVIYETLLNNSGFESSNPQDILNAITTYQDRLKEQNTEDDLLILDDLKDEDIEINLNEDLQTDLINDLDLYANRINKTKNIEDLLDQILNEDEINAIAFNDEEEVKKINLINILNSELTPTKESLDQLDFDFTDEEIFEKLKNKDKKIGSSLQRTIKVYEIYQSNDLLFGDEAEDLSELIVNKLMIYHSIILDFDKIYNISEVFLRETFKKICKFLTQQEILEVIDIININDKTYVQIIKEIVPNLLKYWSEVNETITFNYKEKKELILTLDPNSKLFIDNPSEVKETKVPFERLDSVIGNSREKKLRYPIWFVERVTEEVIEQYQLDSKVYNFIDRNIVINQDDLFYNSTVKHEQDYKFLLDDNLFYKINDFVETILLDSCDNYLRTLKSEIDLTIFEIKELKKLIPNKFITAGGVCFQNLFLDDKLLNALPEIVKVRLRKIEELEFKLLDLEHKYIIKEDILRNVFETIQFSNYNQSLDKVKLISYHYLCIYLEKTVLEFRSIGGPTKVRGFTTPLEIFRYDLLNILCNDSILRKFIFSMRDLVSKWVMKYTFGSRMAKFYFDIMMITPDILTEQILRMLALNIIKNKNPMTLRAIYSSYISLIHLIIDSNINLTDLSKKKYGSFLHLNSYTDDQNERNIVNNKRFRSTFEEECMLKILLYKRTRDLNDNYLLMKRLNIYKLLEVDSLRIYSTKPEELGLFDWYFYYMTYVRHLEKDQDVVYKIKSKFLKSDKRNSQLQIIEIMCQNILFDKIYHSVLDVECTNEILGVIAEDISMRTINRGYMDSNFNLIVKSNQEYLDYIHKTLMEIQQRI